MCRSGETVGVVVAAHEAVTWIAETLASLQAQTSSDWLCVVVDDGSSDGTAEAAEAFTDDSRISVIRALHAGVSAARNRGTAALPAEVTLLSYLDSDDTLLPGALAELGELLAHRPDAVGAYGLAEYLDSAGTPLRPGEHSRLQRDRHAVSGLRLTDVPATADLVFDELVVHGPIWPTAVALLRREIVDSVGGWNPSFTSQQDWELYIRMSRRGSFAALDRQVAWYRRHSRNTTSQAALVSRFQAEVRIAAYEHPANTKRQRTAVARAWRYLTARQALIAGLDAVAAIGGGHAARAGHSGRAMVVLLKLASRRTAKPPSTVLPDLPPPDLRVLDSMIGALRSIRRRVSLR